METIKYLGINIPLNDEKTWEFLREAKNLRGLFQLETSSAAIVLKKIKPKCIEDLSLVNSLNRPGASKFSDEVADVRDGKKSVAYLDPALEPFLNSTYGKLIYQEQVMSIAQKLANFKAKESNALLKALGKKKKDVMKAQKEAFIRGMKENNFDQAVAEKLFEWFEAFADYSFNKSHSAAYSIAGYISAYIKLHHPLEFFTSLLNYSQFEQKPIEEVAEIISELEDFGIQVLPPSIDKLDNKFMIENGAIRYPIGLMKALGETLFLKLKTLTPTQTTTLDRCLEAVISVGLNSRSIESIIISGAMDKFGVDREDVLFYYWFISDLQPEILDKFWLFKGVNPFSQELVLSFLNHREELVGKASKQIEMFTEIKVNKNIKYKSFFKTETTRVQTLARVEGYIKDVEDYKKFKHVSRFFWESYVLGFSYNYKFNAFKTYREIENSNDFMMATVGTIEEIKFRTSHKGNDYAIMTARFDKKIDFMLFGEVAEGAKDIVKKGDFVKLQVSKVQNKLKVESISVINKERDKYEFYRKVEKKPLEQNS